MEIEELRFWLKLVPKMTVSQLAYITKEFKWK